MQDADSTASGLWICLCTYYSAFFNFRFMHFRYVINWFDTMQPLIAVPAVAALVYRAWSRKSLTPAGIVVAAVTAVIHAMHPWSIFLALLCVFFLSGTAVTKA